LNEENGISRSILSISSPGTYLKPGNTALAKDMTRKFNTELSKACAAHPTRLSFFASLPLPDIESSLEEIDFALDRLGAKGFALMSNANGIYLGDASLDPIFTHLNTRKAIIFIHPTSCNVLLHEDPYSHASPQVQTIDPLPQFARPMLEFMFDETRAVINILLSGLLQRCPDIKIIMSHCGCALPTLLERVASFAAVFGGEYRGEEFRGLLRSRFWFDLAGFPFPEQIHGLLRIVGSERLLYGSDYPFTPERMVVGLMEKMDKGTEEIFGKEEIEGVYHGNAEKLFGL
jgi:predicted TIM-barrel fold metal-dependent hydrolase